MTVVRKLLTNPDSPIDLYYPVAGHSPYANSPLCPCLETLIVEYNVSIDLSPIYDVCKKRFRTRRHESSDSDALIVDTASRTLKSIEITRYPTSKAQDELAKYAWEQIFIQATVTKEEYSCVTLVFTSIL